MKRLLVALAALGAVTPLATAVYQGAEEWVEEPKSEVRFPLRIPALGTKDAKHLVTGTGLRTKTIFKVKVYAYALYVDEAGAREHLASWKGKTHDQLAADGKFYSKLLHDDFGKSLRLVMTRDVDGEDMAEAFEDALEPRVELAATEYEMPGGAEALAKFRAFFDVDEIVEDTVLDFTWHKGGKLVAAVSGRVVGTVQNKALCWALFDVYLGSDPIEEKGKRTVIGRFPGILADR